MRTDLRDSSGFTLVEVMIVVVIIGILVAVATPVFFAATANSEQKTCFANQRALEGSVGTWESMDPSTHTNAALAGVVNASSPIVADGIIKSPPRCPAAPAATNPANPTAAEGAYTYDASGNVVGCAFGKLGPHGRFDQ